MDDRGADQHGLRHAVGEQRHEPGPVDAPPFERLGEGLAIFAEIVDPDTLVADQQPPRRLVGELHPAVGSTVSKAVGASSSTASIETVGVDQFVPLVAQLPDASFEHLAEGRRSRSPGRGRAEALAEIAEADRVDEAGELHVGALECRQSRKAAPSTSRPGDHARRAEIRRPSAATKQEAQRDEQEQPPGETEDEAVAKAMGYAVARASCTQPARRPSKAHASPCAGRARRATGRARGGERDVVAVLLQRLLDHLLLDALEIEVVRSAGAATGPRCGAIARPAGRARNPRLENGLAVGQDHRALDRVAQRADVARPVIARPAPRSRARAVRGTARAVAARVEREEMLERARECPRGARAAAAARSRRC